MSYYGGTITVQGRNLITSLIAGETIEFTRVVVGSGTMPDDTEPIDMTDLVNPVALATSSEPTVEDGVLYMVVEYRNDLNGGLEEGFWLSEFGIYAQTEDTEEILLYYATLGDSPQPVNAYTDNRIDVRRYPITIALEVDADVTVTYNPGSFLTTTDAKRILTPLVAAAVAEAYGETLVIDITIPASDWALVSSLEEETSDEESTDTEESTEDETEEEEDSEEETTDDSDEESEETEDEDDPYLYYVDVENENIKESHFATVSLYKESLSIAEKAGLCATTMTQDGYIRFWAEEIPAADLYATVALLLPSELQTTEEITTTYSIATSSDTQAMLEEVFSE